MVPPSCHARQTVLGYGSERCYLEKTLRRAVEFSPSLPSQNWSLFGLPGESDGWEEEDRKLIVSEAPPATPVKAEIHLDHQCRSRKGHDTDSLQELRVMWTRCLRGTVAC